MLLKNFFYHRKSLFDEINTKKFLNKNFYEKLLVRSNLMDLKAIKVLDTDTKIYNVATVSLTRLIFNKTLNFEGFSLNTRKILYTNKRNNVLRFESFLCNFSSKYNMLRSIYKSFKCLQKKDGNSLNSIIILKPIKGGFSCYCTGVVGFIPHRHGLKILKKNFFFSIKAQVENVKQEFNCVNYFLSQGKFTDKYFTPRASFNLGKAELYSRYKRNNFSSSSRKKKDFANDYNFVFLFKK
jgi:hypothetical protein